MPGGVGPVLGWSMLAGGSFLAYCAYKGISPLAAVTAATTGQPLPAAHTASFGGVLAGTAGVEQAALTTGTTAGAGTTAAPAASGARGAITAFALSKVGGQYVWGGNGPSSYDCSGLATAAYKAAGISIPRTSGAESLIAKRIPVGQAQPGDFVFYGMPAEHVGIYLGGGMMVAADHPNAGGPGIGILHEAVYPRNGGNGPAAWYAVWPSLRTSSTPGTVSV